MRPTVKGVSGAWPKQRDLLALTSAVGDCSSSSLPAFIMSSGHFFCTQQECLMRLSLALSFCSLGLCSEFVTHGIVICLWLIEAQIGAGVKL